ncbi:ArnT family glycosyltransferase [Thermodesulfobacteriota bacterium]
MTDQLSFTDYAGDSIRNEWRILAIILFCTFAIRFIVILWSPPWLMVYHFDSTRYVMIARNLVEGNGFSASSESPYLYETYRTPGYPAFLAACLLVDGDNLVVARYCQLLFSVLLCYIVFRMAKQVFGPMPGLFAAGVFACYPFEIYYFSKILTEELTTFFLAACVCMLVLSSRSLFDFLAGLLLAIATLVKPSTLLLPVFLGAGIVLAEGLRARAARRILFFLVGFAPLLLLLGLSNLHHTGRFYVSPPLLWGTMLEGLPGEGLNTKELHGKWIVSGGEELFELEEQLEAVGKNFIKSHPVVYLRHYAYRLVSNWIGKFNKRFPPFLNGLTVVISFGYLALAITGIAASWRRWRRWGILFGVLLFFAAAAAVVKDNARYTIPARPVLIVFAANGLFYCWWFLRNRMQRKKNGPPGRSRVTDHA